MRLSKENVTKELVEEFAEKFKDSDLNIDQYPNQVLYQYQLFILEKTIRDKTPLTTEEELVENES